MPTDHALISWEMPSPEPVSPVNFIRFVRLLRLSHHALIIMASMMPGLVLAALDSYYGLPAKRLIWFLELWAVCYSQFFILLYLALVLFSWLLPVVVRLSPGEGSVSFARRFTRPLVSGKSDADVYLFRYSAEDIVYVDSRNPNRRYLVFDPSILRQPIPLHPQITVDFLRSTLFPGTALKVIRRCRHADRMNSSIWTAQRDESSPPASIALYFRAALASETRDIVWSALGTLPDGVIVREIIEFPNQSDAALAWLATALRG